MKILLTHPVAIIGIALSSIVSIFLIFTGDNTALSFGVGLIGTILSLLIEVLYEQKSMTEKILTAINYNHSVFKHPKVGELFEVIMNCQTKLSQFDDEYGLCIEHFNFLTEEYVNQLNSLASGNIQLCLSVSNTWARSTKLVNRVRKVGKGVAYANQYKQWVSSNGRAYWNAQLDVINKYNVDITRVFIISKKQNLSEIQEFQKVIEEQHNAGVKIKIAIDEDLTSELKRDFAIWDDKYVAISVVGTDGKFSHGIHSVNPKDLKDAQHHFDILVGMSHPFSESISIAKLLELEKE